MQFSPSGGYRRLDSWTLANIAQLATLRFCKKFLTRDIDPTGRQYDQMTQAARSGKVNIVEGSARSSTSRETEMKLTDVARASLGELHSDYEDWLLFRGQAPWRKDSPESQAVYGIRLSPANYGDDYVHDSCVRILEEKKKFVRWLDADDSCVVANAMLIILSRTIHMLIRQTAAQGEDFTKTGGFREQLTGERVKARAAQENAPVCPACGKPMKKRAAKSGKNAGAFFWGCTGYPECKGTREIPPGGDR